MNPSIFQIFTHLGKILETLKDVEKGIQDIVEKKANAADWEKVLADVADLLGAGLINIPGVSQDQLNQIVGSVKGVLPPQS